MIEIDKVKQIVKDEFRGWKFWELAWMAIAVLTIIAVSIYWNESLIGVISAVTGVICVICTGKGKLSAYVFGAINTLLYAIIAFQVKYYGEVMLNALYYFPLQFYGLYVWAKHMNPETNEVIKIRMSNKSRAIIFGAVAIVTLVYGYVLQLMGGNLPYIDALSTVVSVVAMVISIKMYMEQWILWIFVDIVTVIMWAVAFMRGSESIATLLMWVVYLANAVIMYVKWSKEANSRSSKEVIASEI